MAKTTQQFIEIKITALIPAADILDRNKILEQHKRIDGLKTYCNDQTDVQKFETKVINKLVDTEDSAESE
jgi:hypothetical protein